MLTASTRATGSRPVARRAPAEACYVGRERVPLLIAEARGLGADEMARLATTRAFAPNGPFYPGVRAPAPRAYADAVATALSGPLHELMGWGAPPPGGGVEALACDFSLVTTPPEALIPLQRVPHSDGRDPDIVAVLHYLCGPEHGGTGLFRHRVTGFERITEARADRYNRVLDSDVTTNGLPEPGYLQGSTNLFEETARVDAAFGRLIAYPGNALHCGLVPPTASLSPDPTTGRLTVNTFLRRVRA